MVAFNFKELLKVSSGKLYIWDFALLSICTKICKFAMKSFKFYGQENKSDIKV